MYVTEITDSLERVQVTNDNNGFFFFLIYILFFSLYILAISSTTMFVLAFKYRHLLFTSIKIIIMSFAL